MRTIILTLAAASLTTAALPAGAQTWRLSSRVQTELRQDINQLASRIDRARERGTISRREAEALRSQARALDRMYLRYARSGFTRAEVTAIERELNRIRVAIRLERRDFDGRRG